MRVNGDYRSPFSYLQTTTKNKQDMTTIDLKKAEETLKRIQSRITFNKVSK